MQIVEDPPVIKRGVALDAVYGRAPLRGVEVDLTASLFLAPPRNRPAPLLVMLGGGGFRKSAPNPAAHRRLARQLTPAGIALAAPMCRQNATRDDLDPRTQDRFEALDGVRMDEVDPGIAGAAALAAMEDMVLFLRWIDRHRDALGLTGQVVLAGSALGAVTALNAAFLPPWLGLDRPAPAGVLSCSGSFAWPELYRPGTVPVLALHNPADPQIAIAPLREISAVDPGFCLVEAPEQKHGKFSLAPDEPRKATFARLVAFVREVTGLVPVAE